MTRAVVSNLSLRNLLLAVSACLKQFFNHDFASIVLYEEEAGLLRVHALDVATPVGVFSEGALLPMEGTPAGLAIKTRQTVLRERLDLNEFDSPQARMAYTRSTPSKAARSPLVSRCSPRTAASSASLA